MQPGGADEIDRLREPQRAVSPEIPLTERHKDQLKHLRGEVCLLADEVLEVVKNLPEEQVDLLIHALTGLNTGILSRKPLDERTVAGLRIMAHGNDLVGGVRSLARGALKRLLGKLKKKV